MESERSLHFLSDVCKHVPPCVMFSVIYAYFNAWPTDRRFQGNRKTCMLCIECNGEDSIEHYGCCQFGWRAFSELFNVSVFPMTLERMLGLNASSLDMKVFHAVNLYALYSATNYTRYHCPNACLECQVKKLIWHGHIKASLYHKGLRKRYVQRFTSSFSTLET